MNLVNRRPAAAAAVRCGFLLRFLCSSLVASLVWASGCTSQPERADAARRTAASPVASNSTDGLLAGALLLEFADRDDLRALALVARAAEKSSARVDIAWLHAQLCLHASGCRSEPLEGRLRVLAPDNGIAWLGALARAQQQNDQAAEDQILDALSRSKHFDIHWNTLVSRVATALSEEVAGRSDQKLPDPLTRALNQTVNWTSSLAIRQFEPLATTCSAVRVMYAATAQRCAMIAVALQRSDSYIAEGMGLGIAQHIATPGTKEATQVAERIALARYQRDNAGQVIESQSDRDKFTQEMLKLMASLRSEQDVFMAVIRWAGRSPQPPA